MSEYHTSVLLDESVSALVGSQTESTLMPHSAEAGTQPQFFHAYQNLAVCSHSTAIWMPSATVLTTRVLH